MYNSAGRFSTPFKTFSSRRVLRPSIEQGASPPVLWSRGASPLLPGVSFFPGRACQRCNIYLYVNTTLYRNSRISRLYCGKTIKDRDLSFGMVPTHILKAKTAKFQVLTPFRYPIFKVYTVVYNSAGRFSTPLKTFSSRRVFRPFIEQGASPPVLWSRGASPPSSWGCLFPRSRLPAL